jgi:hypothetical protein
MSRREASGNRTFIDVPTTVELIGPRVLKRFQKRTNELDGRGITVHAGNLHGGREHLQQLVQGSVERAGVVGIKHRYELWAQRLQQHRDDFHLG